MDFSMLLSNDCRIWFGTLGSSTCDSNMFHLSKSSSAATTSINAYCFSGGTSCHKHHLQVVVLPSLHLISYSPVHLWPLLHCYSVTWYVSLKNILSEGSTRLKSRLLSILFQWNFYSSMSFGKRRCLLILWLWFWICIVQMKTSYFSTNIKFSSEGKQETSTVVNQVQAHG